jgi:hypothetical protein
MNFWRMQLHPNEPRRATEFAARSLAAGFIGLDHSIDIGDMRKSENLLPPSQRDYFDLALRMQRGDKLLVISHHRPFAFATVDGDYCYVTAPQPELGVWFRHFRRVKDVRFVGDLITNPELLPQLTMTDTIASLGPHTDSYKFIQAHYA